MYDSHLCVIHRWGGSLWGSLWGSKAERGAVGVLCWRLRRPGRIRRVGLHPLTCEWIAPTSTNLQSCLPYIHHRTNRTQDATNRPSQVWDSRSGSTRITSSIQINFHHYQEIRVATTQQAAILSPISAAAAGSSIQFCDHSHPEPDTAHLALQQHLRVQFDTAAAVSPGDLIRSDRPRLQQHRIAAKRRPLRHKHRAHQQQPAQSQWVMRT